VHSSTSVNTHTHVRVLARTRTAAQARPQDAELHPSFLDAMQEGAQGSRPQKGKTGRKRSQKEAEPGEDAPDEDDEPPANEDKTPAKEAPSKRPRGDGPGRGGSAEGVRGVAGRKVAKEAKQEDAGHHGKLATEKRKSDSKQPKRKAKSGFELFFLETKDDILANCKSESFAAIRKRVSFAWEELSAAQREEWHAKATGVPSKVKESPKTKGGETGRRGHAQTGTADEDAAGSSSGKKGGGGGQGKGVGGQGGKGGATRGAADGKKAQIEVKKSVVRKTDSHDEDPTWLGFVYDPASEMQFTEDSFAESTTLQTQTAKAREKIAADGSMQGLEAYSIVRRCRNLQLPSLLHRALIFDWEFVVGKRRVYTLPRDFTVRAVATMYSSSADVANKKEVEISKLRAAFAASICSYFDALARQRLLYNAAELKQHDRLRKQAGDTFSAADVYGAEHLIRLLSCLPELLAAVKPDADKEKQAAAVFHDFLKFFSANFDTFVADATSISRMF
jgi:hypothetical protein